MSVRFLAALVAIGLLVGSAFADKKKIDQAPETGPAPRTVDIPVNLSYPQIVPPQPALSRVREIECQVEFTGTLNTAKQISAPRVIKSYAVADLVVPLPVVGAPPTAASKTLEAKLIQKITMAVEPKSWASAGGNGTIEFFPLGLALVVNAEPAVHAALDKFLDAVRQIQDRQVVTEVRFITVSDAWFENSGLARGFAPTKSTHKPAAMFFANADVVNLLRAAQGDAETNVLQSPKMTCLNGQPGRIRVGETAHYLTGLSVNSVNGEIKYVPKNEAQELGVNLTIEPTVSADGKSVKLAINGSVREHTLLPVPTTPITMLLQPTPESGKNAQPAPLTHFLQQPQIATRTVADTVEVPDGGSVLLYGGKATIQETVKEKVAMMSEVPFLSALFVKERKQTTTNHLLVMVTTRVIHESEMEECVQAAAGSGKLPKLLHEYGRACREGRVDEARRLAMECLVIDPTCFAQK